MGNNPAPINQLHEPTPDGGPDEAAQENCVPAALAWVLEDLAGGTYDGDEIRDSVYPEGYLGGTNIPAYGSFAEAHGVSLSPVYGNGSALVAALRAHIVAGGDALVTIPSRWNDPPPADPAHYSGPTHVCAAAYVLDSDALRLMNPWGGFWQDVTAEWLAPRLCYGVVWLASMIKQETHSMWTRNADQTATDDQGHHVGQGLADAIFNHSLQSVDGLTGENVYDGQGHSYVALANGVLLRWNGASADQDAAFVVVALQEALDAAKSAPAPEPGDPEAEAAKQALVSLKAILAQL